MNRGKCAGLVALFYLAVMVPLGALFSLAAYLVLPSGRRQKASAIPEPLPRRRPQKVSAIILNHNGEDLLRRNLPSVFREIPPEEGHQIILCDNGSTDGSLDYAEDEFAGRLKVIRLDSNLGFGRGNNAAVHEAGNEIIVFLNNDMELQPGFLEPLLEAFRDEGVFASTSAIEPAVPGRPREETGYTVGVWKKGRIRFSHALLPESSLPPEIPALWAGGGSSAFRRDRFLELGGFDELYSPAYVEDTDLSFRAWKRGWRTLHCPQSRVRHEHRVTSSRLFTECEIVNLTARNQSLFHLIHLTSPALFLRFLTTLPRIGWELSLETGLRCGLSFFFFLVRSLAEIRKRRLAGMQAAVVRDEDILSLNRRRLIPGARLGEKRRILMVSAYLPYPGVHAGGARVYRLLEYMASQNHVDLISFIEEEESAERKTTEEVVASLRCFLRQGNLPYVDLWGRVPDSVSRNFFEPGMQRCVEEASAGGLYDLVHCEFLPAAALLPDCLTVTKVLTHHEIHFRSLSYQRIHESSAAVRLHLAWKELQMKVFELGILNRMDHIITCGRADASLLREYGLQCSIQAIETGVDLEVMTPPRIRPRQPKLVFVGFFRHEPNVDAMLFFVAHILPRIRAGCPEVQLDIVGAHPPSEIAALEINPGIRVTGRVPSILPYLHNAGIFVVPIRKGTGIRGKILEAWAAGLPVVTTSLGACGLDAQAGIHYLEADTCKGFAECVLTLFEDPSLSRKIAQAGHRRVRERYSFRRTSSELEDFYASVLPLRHPETMEAVGR